MCPGLSSCNCSERSWQQRCGRGCCRHSPKAQPWSSCHIQKGHRLMPAKKRVLFLCTGNSARSQMAEGLLRQMAGDRFEVSSAGTHPKGMHPRSVEVMNEIGIDISKQTSKDVLIFVNDKFDYVVTVCDRAKQQCP